MDWLYGTVGADLAAVFDAGEEHAWTLTLHGTSRSHDMWMSFGASNRVTKTHATSFDLEFSGPVAATLNGIVSDHIAGANVWIYLWNCYNDFAIMHVWLSGPDMYFYSGQHIGVNTLFPTDADGFPVVRPEPFSNWSDYSELTGNDGGILSRESLVTFAGSVGEPDPADPVVLAVTDASVSEGDGGASRVAVAVNLSSGSSHFTVHYATANGTADAPRDYTATSGTLTFQRGRPAARSRLRSRGPQAGSG